MHGRVIHFSVIAVLLVLPVLCPPWTAQAAELLQNPGFEEGSGHGQPPRPPWFLDYDPGTAGAVTTSTAAHSGTFGLWAYTYDGSASSYSSTYQDIPAQPGRSYQGKAFIRTAPIGGEGGWVTGSLARIRITFMSDGGVPLASYDSESLITPSEPWQEKVVATEPAPEGTAWTRICLQVEKPAGPSGQSVANFDDCSLDEVEVPVLQVSRRALGFGLFRDTLDVVVTNPGSGTLLWNLATTDEWIGVSPSTGETGSEADTITVTVDRSELPGDSLAYHGQIIVESNGGNLAILVYVEHDPSPVVPSGPALVSTNGYLLLVQRRLPDGSLEPLPRPYGIRGLCWSPASVGTLPDRWARQEEFAKWYELDIQMLHEMAANTVYVLLDFGFSTEASALLDYIYINGLLAIVTVDWDGTYDLDRLDAVVAAYKDHPAILMWALGNEWNVNLYHEHFDDLWEAAQATEVAAQRIKSLDSSHPVASIFGEIDIPPDQPLTVTQEIVNEVCPTVDIWGLNIYRGASFGPLFQQWESIADKPMFLSEYGTDSFFSTGWWPVQGYEDETMQADFDHGLWAEIAANLSCCFHGKVCSGGTVFEWCDEWWKTGDPDRHEPDGYETWWNPQAFPDGFGNEEYFGIVQIDRTAKEAYRQFRNDYRAVGTLPCGIDSDPDPEAAASRSAFSFVLAGHGPVVPAAGTSAELRLELPQRTRVSIDILDSNGRVIRTLIAGRILEGGCHPFSWPGNTDRGTCAASGTYFIRARVDEGTRTLKVLLIR